MLLPLLLSLTFVEPTEVGVPPASVGLQWTAPEGCPSQSEVVAELHTLTNGAVEVRADAPTTVDATVTKSEVGFRMDLLIERRGVVETHSLDAKTCGTLARAAVLVAGVDLSREPEPALVAIDERPGPDPTPPSEPPTDVAETPAAPAVAVAANEPEATPARTTAFLQPIRVVAFAGAGPSLGTVPGVTARLAGALGLRRSWWQLEATGFHDFATAATVIDTASLSGSLTGGGIRGCWIPSASKFEFPVCAGVALGSLRTEPSADVQSPQVHRDLWVGGTLSAGLAWVIRDRIALLAQVQGAVSLRRPGVHWNLDASRRLAFRVAPLAGSLILGPQVRLP